MIRNHVNKLTNFDDVVLQKIGLLTRNANGDFEAGILGLELGLIALQRLSPVREAEPEIIALAQATGLSVAIAVMGPLGPTVVRLEEAMRPQHVSLRVGTVLSVVNTAIGRTFAAYLPEELLWQALTQDTIRMAGTRIDAAMRIELGKRLAAIRDQATSGLYRYFRSKDELLSELQRRAVRNQLECGAI